MCEQAEGQRHYLSIRAVRISELADGKGERRIVRATAPIAGMYHCAKIAQTV